MDQQPAQPAPNPDPPAPDRPTAPPTGDVPPTGEASWPTVEVPPTAEASWPTAEASWPTAEAWPPPATPEPIPSPPAGTRRPVRVNVAAAIVAVLLLVLAVNGVAVLVVRGQQQDETSRLDKELAAQKLAQRQAREDLQARYRQADLPGKLRTIRTRNAAATAALISWGNSGQPIGGLKTIRQARNECADAVIDYNTTAARFPNEMLTGVPQRITLSDTTNGCGL